MISIEYDAQHGALLVPQLNIPAKGLVPDKVETFSVHLPCAGNVSVEVPVSINLFVQAPPRLNDTRLNFKRNKICLKGKVFFVCGGAHVCIYWSGVRWGCAFAMGDESSIQRDERQFRMIVFCGGFKRTPN